MKKILLALYFLLCSSYVAADSSYYFTAGGNSKLHYTIPSGYYSDEDLHFRFKNLAENYSPPQNLLAFYTTSADLQSYVDTGEFPFIANGTIVMGQLKSNRAINRSMFNSVKHHLYRNGYNIASISEFRRVFDENQRWFNREFNTRHRARIESIENLGTVVQGLNSAGVMGLVTASHNNKIIKSLEAGGLIYYKNSVLIVSMTRKYNSDNDISILKNHFKKIMNSFK